MSFAQSFGASTSLYSPSPIDRRSAALGGSSLPFRVIPTYSSAPSSRQTLAASAFSTPGRPIGSGQTTPKVRFFLAQSLSGYPQPSIPASSSATPPSSTVSRTPATASHAVIGRASPAAVAPPTQATPPTAAHPSKSSNLRQQLVVGRGEVARRLRVNACLLVTFWLSARTHLYSFLSGHLVQFVPSLDTPLHLLESAILVLLALNIAQAMYSLNGLSSLPPPPPLHRVASPTLSPKQVSPPSSPPFTTPLRSSPKTRPSPSLPTSPSPSLSSQSPASSLSPFRGSTLRNSSPLTPQTPSAAPRLRSSSLRRSTLPPSPKTAGLTIGGEAAIVAAYCVRHSEGTPSPGALARASLNRSVNSQEGIDRLLDIQA